MRRAAVAVVLSSVALAMGDGGLPPALEERAARMVRSIEDSIRRLEGVTAMTTKALEPAVHRARAPKPERRLADSQCAWSDSACVPDSNLMSSLVSSSSLLQGAGVIDDYGDHDGKYCSAHNTSCLGAEANCCSGLICGNSGSCEKATKAAVAQTVAAGAPKEVSAAAEKKAAVEQLLLEIDSEVEDAEEESLFGRRLLTVKDKKKAAKKKAKTTLKKVVKKAIKKAKKKAAKKATKKAAKKAKKGGKKKKAKKEGKKKAGGKASSGGKRCKKAMSSSYHVCRAIVNAAYKGCKAMYGNAVKGIVAPVRTSKGAVHRAKRAAKKIRKAKKTMAKTVKKLIKKAKKKAKAIVTKAKKKLSKAKKKMKNAKKDAKKTIKKIDKAAKKAAKKKTAKKTAAKAVKKAVKAADKAAEKAKDAAKKSDEVEEQNRQLIQAVQSELDETKLQLQEVSPSASAERRRQTKQSTILAQ